MSCRRRVRRIAPPGVRCSGSSPMRATRPRNANRTTPSWKTPRETGSGTRDTGYVVTDVLILVGSESDKPRIEPAFEILSKAGVSYEFHASSAHRQPDQRSEEHTSELQSRLHLVCRLLLEKKKKQEIYKVVTL